MIAFFAVVPAGAESFKSWAARGAREERERDPKAAASSYSNALTLWKENDGAAAKAKVLCARSTLREQDGDQSGALADLSACLSLDKKNAKGFHRRGLMEMKSGDTSAAIGDFYRAVALDARFGQAYFDRARAYESQGEKGFAGEDYRHACERGVKAACPKAKELAAMTKSRPKPKPDAPAHAKAADAPPSDAPAQKAPPPEAAPAARKTPAKPTSPSAYRPRYNDCLHALEACVEGGDSFGACVRAAPDCANKPAKGCCPAACLKAYQKATNADRSEASAYREHFSADAACGAPPKAAEDD